MKHLRILVVALLVGLMSSLVAVPPATASPPGKNLDRGAVDDYVSDYLHRNGLPGACIAVVKDGKVEHVTGFGDNDGRSITGQTPMALGSVSKSFTAFAVLQLVDTGKIDLDKPVVSYLPQFRVSDPRGSQITVRQLLSHTSGLTTPTIVPPADTLKQAVARTHDWQLTADPGTHYAYSNANYWVAARLVAVVSGESFSDYLHKNVFAPLGMKHTRSVTTTDVNDDGLTNGHVTAYGTSLPLREMDAFMTGAGGVVTTAHDMAQWLAMQTNDGVTPNGKQLLSPKLLKKSHTRQPNAKDYALGWEHSGSDITPQRISHSGQLSRYMAQQDLVPSSGYGVAVMQNSFTPTLEHPYEISSGIIDITEGRSPEPGLPIPTLIDAALGLITLGVIALAIRGLRRSRGWVHRRAGWRTWRFGLRLLPQLIAPAAAVVLFFVFPALQHNSATPVDVFGLWPALTILLLTLAITGITLTLTRSTQRLRTKPDHRSMSDVADGDFQGGSR